MKNITNILIILGLTGALSACYTAAVAAAGAGGGYILGEDKEHHEAKEKSRAENGE